MDKLSRGSLTTANINFLVSTSALVNSIVSETPPNKKFPDQLHSLMDQKMKSKFKEKTEGLPKVLLDNWVIVGASVVGFVAIFLALFIFNDISYYKENKVGVEFAIQFDPYEQNSKAWVTMGRSFYIESLFYNLVKITKNEKKHVGLMEVFPVGGKSQATADVHFTIHAADQAVMPDMTIDPKKLVPMLYIRREAQPHAIVRYFMTLTTRIINNWTLVKWTVWILAVLCILIGLKMRFQRSPARNIHPLSETESTAKLSSDDVKA